MRLDVLIDGHVAGELDQTDHEAPSFRYTEEHLRGAAPTPLSVRMPVTDATVGGSRLGERLRGLLPDSSRALRGRCEQHAVDEKYPPNSSGLPTALTARERSGHAHRRPLRHCLTPQVLSTR